MQGKVKIWSGGRSGLSELDVGGRETCFHKHSIGHEDNRHSDDSPGARRAAHSAS